MGGRARKPSGGKGKSKGRGKGKRPKGAPRPKARARPNAKGQPPPPPRPSWGRPDRPAGKPRAAPICFRCGKTGHLSANCTNAPNAKRSKPTDSADVIFDMTPWADEFAEWRRNQSMNEERGPGLLSGPQQNELEDVNGLEETKGCAIMDSGATVMCSSTAVAEEIQMQRLRRNDPADPKVSGSDRCFRFADGRTGEAQHM